MLYYLSMTQKSLSKNLSEHLKKEHKMTPVAAYLKEIVYGGTDGIVTTFAVVGGFAGAQTDVNAIPIVVVLLFGLANLFADGTSMGLSNFLSIRSGQDVYNAERAREMNEVKTNPKAEFEETIEILMDKGFSKKDAEEIAKLYSKNPEYWTDFMMNHELELPNPTNENPYLTGLATFLTFFALLLLGVLRLKVTKESPMRSVGEILLLGGVSATLAFFVGTFFRA